LLALPTAKRRPIAVAIAPRARAIWNNRAEVIAMTTTARRRLQKRARADVATRRINPARLVPVGAVCQACRTTFNRPDAEAAVALVGTMAVAAVAASAAVALAAADTDFQCPAACAAACPDQE
jgi:hypothetical protein